MLHTIDGKFNIFTDKGLIGRVWDNIEGAEANAHLIAAAPLMCGQLQTGIKALGEALQSLGNGQVSEAKDYIKGVIAGNEMALIKAEGREE